MEEFRKALKSEHKQYLLSDEFVEAIWRVVKGHPGLSRLTLVRLTEVSKNSTENIDEEAMKFIWMDI